MRSIVLAALKLNFALTGPALFTRCKLLFLQNPWWARWPVARWGPVGACRARQMYGPSRGTSRM